MYNIKLLSIAIDKFTLSRDFQTCTFSDYETIGIREVATIGNHDDNLADIFCDLSNMDSFVTTNYDGTFTLYEYVVFADNEPIACSGSSVFDYGMWIDSEYIDNNIIGLHDDEDGNPYYISETYRRYEIAEITEFNSIRKDNSKTFDIAVILYMNPDDDMKSPIVDYYFGASFGFSVDDIRLSIETFERNNQWIV